MKKWQDAPAPSEEKPTTEPGMRTVIWVHDGPVCVTVIDDSPCPTPALHCQCQACSAANHVEWAARYLAPPG